ncbi:MAG: hypothetical protein PHH06_05395 [Candidatus Gracilibacteria bacterium]|nr:hypothetical protein [Candidatus Gracilibacteria bacterium]
MTESNYNFFLKKLLLIEKEKDIDIIITKYYKKVGIKGAEYINDAAFLEALIFLKEFLKKNMGAIKDIEWIREKNFVLYMNDIYMFNEESWVLQKGKKVFVTSRDSWYNPFFLCLNEISKYNEDIKLLKPNLKELKWMYFDKGYFTSKLLYNGSKYLGKVAFPLMMKKDSDSIKSLLLFINSKFGDKIVIKGAMGEMGNQVRAIRLSDHDIDKLAKDLEKKYFYLNCYGFNVPYFVEYYDIKNEFRIYYTRDYYNNKLKVFSVKKKNNEIIGEGDIFSKDSLAMYKDINVTRSIGDIDDFKVRYKYIIDSLDEISSTLTLETGVIELADLGEKGVKFIEVNQLGGSLMFPGKDEEKMKDLYSEMWNNMFMRIGL